MRLISTLFSGVLLAVTAHAQVVDTTGTWNGSSSIAPFGEPNTATYGQTFRTPVGSAQLNDFSFWLETGIGGGADGVDFAAYVMEWDPALTRATGSILFQSTQQLLPNPTAMTQVSFNTGGLLLDSSKQYVAFLSASNFFDGNAGTANMGYVGSDVYADGGFWFFNHGSNFGMLTSSSWESFVGGGVDDTAFRANFGPGQVAVPEPSTYGMVAAGALIGLVVLRRRGAKQVV
jgi:hypothetical protein